VSTLCALCLVFRKLTAEHLLFDPCSFSSTKMSADGFRAFTPPRAPSLLVYGDCPRTPSPRVGVFRASTPGLRQAAQPKKSNLLRLLEIGGNNLVALEAALQADPCAAVLPLKRGQPVLIAAMSSRCSPAVLRLLLRYGAQHEQTDMHGRGALDALLAMRVFPPRQRQASLHVNYAISLLAFGAQPTEAVAVGDGNEACRACVRSYADAMASVLIRQWMQDADKDFLSIVAAFLHA